MVPGSSGKTAVALMVWAPLETVVVMLAVLGSPEMAMALVALVVPGLLEKVSMALLVLASLVKAGMVLDSREKVGTELASPEGTVKALMAQVQPEKA